jgi:hypothetical protein
MLRDLPIDTTQLQPIAMTAAPAPLWEWIEKDGRRQLSGEQSRDRDTGEPEWEVAVMVRDGEGNPEMLKVRIASKDEPKIPGEFLPVPFDGLLCKVGKSKTGDLRQYWSATGIKAAPTSSSRPIIGDNSGKAA